MVPPGRRFTDSPARRHVAALPRGSAARLSGTPAPRPWSCASGPCRLRSTPTPRSRLPPPLRHRYVVAPARRDDGRTGSDRGHRPHLAGRGRSRPGTRGRAALAVAESTRNDRPGSSPPVSRPSSWRVRWTTCSGRRRAGPGLRCAAGGGRAGRCPDTVCPRGWLSWRPCPSTPRAGWTTRRPPDGGLRLPGAPPARGSWRRHADALASLPFLREEPQVGLARRLGSARSPVASEEVLEDAHRFPRGLGPRRVARVNNFAGVVRRGDGPRRPGDDGGDLRGSRSRVD